MAASPSDITPTDISKFLRNQAGGNDTTEDYEYQLAQDPLSFQTWWSYISKSAENERLGLYERALEKLPRSYKLWKNYLDERRRVVRGTSLTNQDAYGSVMSLYEKALQHLPTMPRLWLDYTELLVSLKFVTKTRRTFDNALRSLPVSQHHRIWPPFLSFVKNVDISLLVVKIYNRYLMYNPRDREEFIAYLVEKKFYSDAMSQIADALNLGEQDVGGSKASNHRLWMQLCDLISSHPDSATSVPSIKDVESILKSGIRQFTDEVGHLWCSLATYYVRLGKFETARDKYEEAIESVTTVRDFSMIFEAYSKFEEELLTAKMTMAATEDDEEDAEELQDEIEMRLARLEYLMERRPLLLNSVLLRQNPHNVREWQKRIDLINNSTGPSNALRVYTEAVKKISPAKASGKLWSLWVNFAKFYETEGKDISSARVVLKKATTEVGFKSVEELARVYCEWAELEIRAENYDEALALMRNATKQPDRAVILKIQARKRTTVHERLYKSTRLWSSYLDLEEGLGSVQSTREAYDRAMELKVATCQMVINYANFLKENSYFEDSFRIYERGLAVFGFPHALELWKIYLKDFVTRFRGKKLERARDLFEQVLGSCPAENKSYFYKDYADLEENFGLIRRSMKVYSRACEDVPNEEKFDLFLRHIKKMEEFFGVAESRPIYEKAIEVLPDAVVPLMCIKFANMEKQLGEVDRARALWSHASQFCDPRQWEEKFWKKWHEFEVEFGNEQTFLEMLRIKRSVAAQFSHVNYMTVDTSASAEMVPATSSDPMARLEMENEGPNSMKRKADEGGISAETDAEAEARATTNARQQKTDDDANPEEIDIDDDMDDDDIDDIQEKNVPEAVFGKKNLGALERLKNRP